MELVEPIRSTKKIDALKKYLRGAGSVRNYALVVVGMNTALRISDILGLTWEDVYDFDLSKLKSHVWVKERKTGKVKKFFLNESARNALNSLLKDRGRVVAL